MITEYELYSDERKEKHNRSSYLTIGGLNRPGPVYDTPLCEDSSLLSQ
jgi:hypothetical protein